MYQQTSIGCTGHLWRLFLVQVWEALYIEMISAFSITKPEKLW